MKINLHVKKLHSFWEKTVGLIGKKKIYPVFFTTRFGIHTFGMKNPIDILILDNQYRVVKIKEKILPNRLYFWPIRFKHVIELPQNSINDLKIHNGNIISFL